MIDLHLHLDGSLDAEEIWYLASLANISLPVDDVQKLLPLLSVTGECQSLGEYLEKFDLPLLVLQSKETITHAVYSLIEKLAKQGLCYAEIRFAPQLHLKNGLTQKEVVHAAVEGMQRGNRDFGFSSQLILCCMRGNDNYLQNLETVQTAKAFLGKGVCGVDIAGNEAAYPTKDFANIFAFARQQQIPFTIHAGEAAGADSVRTAVHFGAVRIGHGIHAIEDKALLKLLQERNVMLELCYTSNLQTKAVKTPAEYPLMTFLNQGIGVTLNTDNMVVSNTTLKQEYQLVKQLYSLSDQQLKEIAFHAAAGAMISESEKSQLKEKIQDQFDQWIA